MALQTWRLPYIKLTPILPRISSTNVSSLTRQRSLHKSALPCSRSFRRIAASREFDHAYRPADHELTPRSLEIFPEYTRRQYLAKAPLRNPFGDVEEDPVKFEDLDIFTRIRVLQQLTTWTFFNETRIRERMPEEDDHLTWRMDPIGWDKEDRSYYVLDDNRMYRRTDARPPPPLPVATPKPKPKAKSKKAVKPRPRGTRSSKRFKAESEPEDEDEEMLDAEGGAQDDTVATIGAEDDETEHGDFGFTNNTWECIAITLEDYQEFLATIFRSRDPNEKQLRQNIEADVLPILEKRAEAIRQKQLKKLRELENIQKMSGAKRSSRLAVKADREKEEREAREAEEKKRRDLEMAHAEEERLRRVEEVNSTHFGLENMSDEFQGHESRRMTREQRLKERETKRILAEEELARLEADAENAKRQSERQLKTQREQLQKDLEENQEDEGDWYFDCAKCGMHGENLDDGAHSMACEKCNVWQHSACHGFAPEQAERDDFVFICHSCKKNEEDAKKPKIPSLKLTKRSSDSPESQRGEARPVSSSGPPDSGLPPHVQRQLDGVAAPVQLQPQQAPRNPGFANGTAMPPFQAHYPPHLQNAQPRLPQPQWHGSPLPPPGRLVSNYAGSPSPTDGNGYPAQHHHHQEQHQYAHQYAVQNSGAHPGYQPQSPQNTYSHSPQPSRALPLSSPPPLRQPPNPYASQPNFQRFSPPQLARQPEQPPHRPSSSHLMNGFQSPAKRAPSSPVHLPTQPTPQPRQSPMVHSPMTSFPPPSGSACNAGHSPTKSSPPPQPRVHATPSNGHTYPAPHFQTPTNGSAAPPAPPSSVANGVAADGMSGPWPESSKTIPQKHDQSPAPQPLPATMLSRTPASTELLPPNLIPSPVQVAQGEKGSVPVKKELEAVPANAQKSEDRVE